MDEFGLPVPFPEPLNVQDKRISDEVRGVVRGHEGVDKNNFVTTWWQTVTHPKQRSIRARIGSKAGNFRLYGVNPKSCPLFKGRPITA
jgi:hypothetical protein